MGVFLNGFGLVSQLPPAETSSPTQMSHANRSWPGGRDSQEVKSRGKILLGSQQAGSPQACHAGSCCCQHWARGGSAWMDGLLRGDATRQEHLQGKHGQQAGRINK